MFGFKPRAGREAQARFLQMTQQSVQHPWGDAGEPWILPESPHAVRAQLHCAAPGCATGLTVCGGSGSQGELQRSGEKGSLRWVLHGGSSPPPWHLGALGRAPLRPPHGADLWRARSTPAGSGAVNLSFVAGFSLWQQARSWGCLDEAGPVHLELIASRGQQDGLPRDLLVDQACHTGRLAFLDSCWWPRQAAKASDSKHSRCRSRQTQFCTLRKVPV